MTFNSVSIDDLLRQQEVHPRKKRRLSESEFAEGSSSDAEQFEPSTVEDDESESDNVQVPSEIIVQDRLGSFGQRNHSRNAPVPTPPSAPPASSFASLGISRPLQAALKSMSIKSPTIVQSACIPALLDGKYVSNTF